MGWTNGFTLPGINGLLALLSVDDPFMEKPEETYSRIEDFVIENLEALLEQTIPIAEEQLAAHKKEWDLTVSIDPDSLSSLDEWIVIITKMAAHALVESIIDFSGTKEMILRRYSESAIRQHVFDRVKAKIKNFGIRV
jgi:RNase adaptor protein for sRNA GlmZ degradation